MKMLLVTSMFAAFGFLFLTEARAADQATLDHLVEYAKQACLVGTQYDFNADLSGNITFKNPLKPGGEGKAAVNVRNSTGAAAIFDQQLRVAADENTRRCMGPRIDKIIAYVLGPKPCDPSHAKSYGREFNVVRDFRMARRGVGLQYRQLVQ